jgi:hypothetical protein
MWLQISFQYVLKYSKATQMLAMATNMAIILCTVPEKHDTKNVSLPVLRVTVMCTVASVAPYGV